MKLTPDQIAAVAARAGFRGEALARAVAVALAESGGDTQAVGVNTDKWRSRDRGLWQINNHWHPEVSDAAAFDPTQAAAAAYRISGGGENWSQWSTWNNGAAASQYARARVAVYRLAQTGGKSAGNVATVGFLPSPSDLLEDGVKSAVPGLGALSGLGDVAGGSVGDVAGAITAPVEAARTVVVLAVKAGAWMSDSHNWVRVGMVAGGAVGVLMALRMIGDAGGVADTVTAPARAVKSGAEKAAGAAMMVTPGGAAAKAGKIGAAKGIKR